MKLNDDIESLRNEVTELHRTLEVTNARLADLANPPMLKPLREAAKFGEFMTIRVLDTIINRVLK